MDSSDKYVGKILDNRYEILERIGTGGMALVYKARCHRLNRLVAIKILKEDLASDEDFRRRFHTESQAVAMLSHPNIVAVYDVSRSGSTEYIVMELIEGITLKQYINRKGLLNWKEALHFTTQITKALSHAHSRGIIHRDIKPHNIMILKDGSVKVADFGIARLLTMQNTLTQEALGSVHYISPEQAKGGHVDARSDIYSVGVVMYEMLTSRLPFVGDSAVSVAIQHISAIPLMPRDINPDIPEGLESITMHAMEPELHSRFGSADEMLADLEEFRKNPAVSLQYAKSELHSNQSGGDPSQATKTLPTSSIIKAERTLKKRQPVRKPEMTKDEYRTTSRRASGTSTLIGIFSIIVFLVVAIVFMWNYLLKDIFSPPEKEMVSIPRFVGQLYSDVSQSAEYTELFNFIVASQENSTEYAAGYIISQKPVERQQTAPAAGKKIDVELVVSLGEEDPITVPMPYLINKHFNEAKNELDNLDLDLIVEFDRAFDNDVTKDYVIETMPAEGATLARGNTIILKYSLGPEIKKEIVPDLRGQTRAAVESAFKYLELVPKFEYFENDAEKDTVLFIAKAGEEVEIKTEIVVHLSSGPPQLPPDASPTETETPTPDDTPTPDETPPQLPSEGVEDWNYSPEPSESP